MLDSAYFWISTYLFSKKSRKYKFAYLQMKIFQLNFIFQNYIDVVWKMCR